MKIIEQDPQPNVYQMYFEGNQEELWLTRTSWVNLCAKVMVVGQPSATGPYFGNPSVYADLYFADTGVLKQKLFEITAAGTYKTWRQIEKPRWAR